MEEVLKLVIIHLIRPKCSFSWVYQQEHRSYLFKLLEMWNYFIDRYLRSFFCFDFLFLRGNFFFRWLFFLFFWFIFIFLRTHGLKDFFINILYQLIINFLDPIFNFINLLFHVVINVVDFLGHIIIDFLYVVFLYIITNVFLHLFVTFNCHFFIHWLLLVALLSHNKVFLFSFRTFSWWFCILLYLLHYFSDYWCLSYILVDKSAPPIALEVYLGCDSILSRAYWIEPNWLLKLI